MTAILGAGLFVKQAYLPALTALGSAVPPLKAVYSRSEKSSSELALEAAKLLDLSPDIYYDIGDDPSKNLDVLLGRSDISAVIIALPITLQPDIVLKCLKAGKHVLSEKPMAPDVARGLKLIRDAEPLCKQGGLIWRVAENFEAEPGYRAAGEIVRSGKIGKWYNTPWRTVPDVSTLDGGVHTVAALRTILPEPFTELSGFASLNKDYLIPHDTIHSVVRAGHHYHGIVEMTFASPTKSTPKGDNIVITGTDGWLACNKVRDSLELVIKVRVKEEGKPEEEQEYQEKEQTLSYPSRNGVEDELLDFFNKIQGREALDIGRPRNALKDVAFIQAALTSEGKLIDLLALVA
ncbi:hypothetical protein BDP27DRAFT_1312801 [Rhodocollybia butyracea]|uniref:Gfo/Idh/MocA-like oxidoreductase N-terminal domain-containing protein n=1 Tax=Rhodocollybia butyracea TaxID=206335 RepID=A0A9P5UF52_9AGAR|nr:hypothetical protein BDP27DRAFT_1312801 [Rhodocollybia butyracea]